MWRDLDWMSCAIVRDWNFADCGSESKMMSASPGPCDTALGVSNSSYSGGTSKRMRKTGWRNTRPRMKHSEPGEP